MRAKHLQSTRRRLRARRRSGTARAQSARPRAAELRAPARRRRTRASFPLQGSTTIWWAVRLAPGLEHKDK